MAEPKSKSKSRRKSPYATRRTTGSSLSSLNTPTTASKRALEPLFESPDASHSFLSASVSLSPSLSPRPAPPSDRVLTFLQSARDRDVPVRFGKWSGAEDAYLAKLVALFSAGLLADLDAKTTLRSWLALMLNCCPMRISKKQMHGHGFSGKTKFRHSAKAERMTQDKHRRLLEEIETLRSAFVRAWAFEEIQRRHDCRDSIDEWVDRLQQLVPSPILVKPVQDEKKSSNSNSKQRPKTALVEIKPARPEPKEKEESKQQVMDVAPLEPAPIPAIDTAAPTPPPAPVAAAASSTSSSALVPASYSTAMAPSYFDEPVSLGEWLVANSSGRGYQWNDIQSVAHVGEARYTYCEDEVQVSVHLGDQQNVSMTRRSSRVVIDFGAPSCWHTGEEPKRSSFSSDCMPWSDNDLVEEEALLMDSGMLLGWDDASSISTPYTTYSPPLNL